MTGPSAHICSKFMKSYENACLTPPKWSQNGLPGLTFWFLRNLILVQHYNVFFYQALGKQQISGWRGLPLSYVITYTHLYEQEPESSATYCIVSSSSSSKSRAKQKKQAESKSKQSKRSKRSKQSKSKQSKAKASQASKSKEGKQSKQSKQSKPSKPTNKKQAKRVEKQAESKSKQTKRRKRSKLHPPSRP